MLNEAKELKYNSYKDILKENKGKKPQNLRILINDRIRNQLADLENRFVNGVQEEIEKFQQPVRMISPDGRPVDIPPNQIQNAINAGASFPQ